MMIKKLLIANRGEIAVRIIKTCRRLGIRTIAVYSEADRNALHVQMADRACLLGPAEASASYLRADKIIAVAEQMGADAIHPGYGFLAESQDLISLCEEKGIVFIGPSRTAIVSMGSKIEAKAIAERAGVPVIPGYHGGDQTVSVLQAEAEKIGFPLLIKASAGGGGKGMRRVDAAADFEHALALAKQEAASAFGDDSVLLEKLILSPRHIEVQLAADKHGNIIHLFERECSIQRNHQKVIEEAPAAFLSDAQKNYLYDFAVRLGKAIAYDSLGTIECMLDDQSGELYFLEMNTRLQVEHPVTEEITGLDLVELQLRIAAGEPLPVTQDQVRAAGWAIEARLNAEDPAQGYLPEVGQVIRYREPVAEGVRVDSGIQPGSVISPFYDPMIAKVITYGETRAVARQRLSTALSDFGLIGVGNNRRFLQDILDQPQFLTEPLTTNYLADVFPDGWERLVDNTDLTALAAAVFQVMRLEQVASGEHMSPWQSLGAWRLSAQAGEVGVTSLLLVDEADHIHTIKLSGHGGYYIWHQEGKTTACHAAFTHQNELIIEVDGVGRRYEVSEDQGRILLLSGGESWQLTPLSQEQAVAREQEAGLSGGTDIFAAMPGRITTIEKSPGDPVIEGEKVVLMEAMKLLHTLVAPVSGTIKGIYCEVSENVDAGALLVEIEADD